MSVDKEGPMEVAGVVSRERRVTSRIFSLREKL